MKTRPRNPLLDQRERRLCNASWLFGFCLGIAVTCSFAAASLSTVAGVVTFCVAGLLAAIAARVFWALAPLR